jgi:hypothetical protein
MPRRNEGYSDLYTKDEVQAFILSRYVQGIEEEQIREDLKTHLHIELKEGSHEIRHEVRLARRQGRLRYVPARDRALEQELDELLLVRNKKLSRIKVVTTTLPLDVAKAGADMLADEINSYFQYDPDREKIELGFAGGRTPSLMVQALSESLRNWNVWAKEILDKHPTIVCHSLVGNMNPKHMEVDPNSYLVYLASMGSELYDGPFTLRFNNMPAPGLVTPEEYRRLTGQDGGPGFALIKAALQRRDELDFVVTSCAHWGTDHRSIRDYITEACAASPELKALWEETIRALDEQNVIGDLMWWPISRNNIEVESKLRVMSMMTLPDLIRFVHPEAFGDRPPVTQSRAGKALLLAGPCSRPDCQKSKGEILGHILQMRHPPVTHLVTDSRSCRDCIKIIKESKIP